MPWCIAMTRWPAILPLVMAATVTSAGAAQKPKASAGRAPATTWYMGETATAADGRLTFLDKPWWPKAQALAEGQSFTLDLDGNGRPDTIVKRENGHIVEAIDDSGRAPAEAIWSGADT